MRTDIGRRAPADATGGPHNTSLARGGARTSQRPPNRGRCSLDSAGLLQTVCIYAGSLDGARPEYAAGAEAFARLLAADGIGIVYGGGRAGLMGAVADAARDAGGTRHRRHPRASSSSARSPTRTSTTCASCTSMHERKALMAELADAFVAVPGGIGTLEELVEVFTWAQLGMHRKPVALLDLGGYYRGLVEFFDHADGEGFLRPTTRAMLARRGRPGAAARRGCGPTSRRTSPQWIDVRGT